MQIFPNCGSSAVWGNVSIGSLSDHVLFILALIVSSSLPAVVTELVLVVPLTAVRGLSLVLGLCRTHLPIKERLTINVAVSLNTL